MLAALAGCNFSDNYNKTLDDYAAKYATEASLSKQYISLLEAHDFAAVEQKIDPRLRNDQLHSNLEKLAALFPDAKPTDAKLIGLWRNDFSGDGKQSSLTTVTYEYSFSQQWLQATVVLKKINNDVYIAGIHAIPLQGDLEKLTQFKLSGKSPINYIMLAATCIIPLFIIFALIVCIRTPIPKRKWLWIAFILLGVVRVILNWMDSGIRVNPFALDLFGAGFTSGGPYSPVILWFSFPLGAIVFLLKRKKWAPIQPSPPLSGGAGVAATIYSGAPRKTFGRRGSA